MAIEIKCFLFEEHLNRYLWYNVYKIIDYYRAFLKKKKKKNYSTQEANEIP